MNLRSFIGVVICVRPTVCVRVSKVACALFCVSFVVKRSVRYPMEDAAASACVNSTSTSLVCGQRWGSEDEVCDRGTAKHNGVRIALWTSDSGAAKFGYSTNGTEEETKTNGMRK